MYVAAQQNGDLRLQDQDEQYVSGRVELYLDGVWGTVDAGTGVQLGPAQTICRQLGYFDSLNSGTVIDLG